MHKRWKAVFWMVCGGLVCDLPAQAGKPVRSPARPPAQAAAQAPVLAPLPAAISPAPIEAAVMAPFTVQDIRVEGLQRIAPGTVFNYLSVKVGDRMDETGATDAIRALYKTGFFKDVRLQRHGDVLLVSVIERPAIDSLKIIGSKVMDEETLKKGLTDVGLAEGRVLDPVMLDRAEQEFRQLYLGKGYYGVKIRTTTTPLERNRVAIRIDITEGETARIAGIRIIGNQAFDDETLMDQFKLRESGLFSFFTSNDQYSKQQLGADLESLRNYYQNRGYLDFQIESTQVALTPAKDKLHVTVNITEGRPYRVSELKLAGKFPVPESELRALVPITAGSVFSRAAATEASKAITDRLSDAGYAFASVNVSPEPDRDAATVKLAFFVDPGSRVYIRRIEFRNNHATNDEVLRRELRQLEGGWYSASRLRRSRERLMRLGYFDEVDIETPAVAGTPDQVDVVISVKERLVNNFVAGIGYSDADGFLVNMNVTLRNLAGTGNELTVSVDNSRANKHLNLSYTDPYFTEDGISRSLSLYASSSDAAEANTAAYDTQTTGVGMFFGIPISEERSISAGLAVESIAINAGANAAIAAQQYVAQFGARNTMYKLTAGWSYDTLDTPIFPSRGLTHKLSLELGLPGSDIEYYRLTYAAAAYASPFGRTTFRLKGDLGYGDGYGANNTLPFYKNFFAGGSSSVRGYDSRSLGPKDLGGPDPSLPVGGSVRVLGNAEVLFQIPGVSEDNKSMRFGLFIDTGMAYGPNQAVDLSELRHSAGIAYYWYAPVGPLSISLAKTLNAEPGDNEQSIQFTLGTPFR